MEKIKPILQSKIDKIRKSPDSSGLAFKTHGKSSKMEDYTDREINEMYLGIYKDKKFLLVDGDYFINLQDVVESECILASVSYIKKPTLKDYKDNSHNILDNIRTFYVENYFLITKSPVSGETKHKITRYLEKVGSLKKGIGNNYRYHSISNDYKSLQNGYPKDLFHPIKRHINGLFFENDYKISKFNVISDIVFIDRS